MKKILFLIVICWTITINLFGQKITKEEAQILLDKAFVSLKKSDTTSFLNLWLFDTSTTYFNKKPFDAF